MIPFPQQSLRFVSHGTFSRTLEGDERCTCLIWSYSHQKPYIYCKPVEDIAHNCTFEKVLSFHWEKLLTLRMYFYNFDYEDT